MSKCLVAGAIAALALSAHEGHASTLEDAVSLGTPNRGQLVDGKLFRATPYMITIPARAKSPVRWALPALLGVLDRASRAVARKYPGSVLEVGELSRREGGPAASHRSHQNGRDADVSFFVTDLYGEGQRLTAFTRFDASGEGTDDPWLRFDDARNWAFVRALLEDSETEVRQIFVYAPLRARLLAYAASVRAPHAIRAKAAAAMMQPMNALPHDDHFHIRISCPVDQLDRGCSDLPLWREMGSPDEFGPTWLARWTSSWQLDSLNAVPPDGWGNVARLWSAERSVCRRADLSCGNEDDQPICEDDFDPAFLDLAFPSAPTATVVRGAMSPETMQLELSLRRAGILSDGLGAWPWMATACIPDIEEGTEAPLEYRSRPTFGWDPRGNAKAYSMTGGWPGGIRKRFCSQPWAHLPFVWRTPEPDQPAASVGPAVGRREPVQPARTALPEGEGDQLAAD